MNDKFGLTKWTPFEELNTLHREMDRLFSRVWGVQRTGESMTTFRPAMEVYNEKDAWHVRLAVPGVDAKDIQLDVTGNTLTVRGERKEERRQGESYLSEFAYGRFERSLTLPEALDVDQVKAVYRNGVLELALPLKEGAKPRRIEITSEDQKQLAA